MAVLVAAGMLAAAPAAAADTVVTAVDFEDGTTGTWTPSGGAGLEVLPDPDGAGSVLAITRAADYEGIQSPTGIFRAGVTYTFSMRARVAEPAEPTGPTSADVRFVMKPSYTWIGNTTIGTDWTTVTGMYTADGDPAELQAYLGSTDQAAPYTILVDDIMVTTSDTVPPGDVVPGGAINPVPTPAYAAEGAGDVSALTFDDGPNPGTTPALLDFLAEHDIKAVFCVIGQNIEADGGAAILRRIVADGHVLCNHSTGYADMGSWTEEQVRADLVANLGIIRDALGNPNQKIPFWRAPNGSWGVTPGVAVELGMQPLAVRNAIADWETQDVETLTANLRTAMVPGELVLAHDGGGDRSGTLAAVRTVVTERLADGWSFTFPQGTPPASGPVISTNFEDGTLGGWVPREGTETSDFTLAVTDSDAHDSTRSAALTGRDATGDGIARDVTGVLRAGVAYDASAWVRFAESQTPGDVWLSLATTTDGAQTFSTLGQFSGITNTGWTQVTATFTVPAHDDALLYFETAYNGGNTSDWLIDDIVVSVPEPPLIEDLTGIKETVDFPMGVAVDSRETSGAAAQLLNRHFGQITPENHMKPEAWYDDERTFRRHPEATALMDFAQANDLRVYGHVLVWHGQTPDWFFQDDAGEPLPATAEGQAVLRERLRTHIFDVAEDLSTEYGPFGSDTNPLVAFDVVNEVVSDGAENPDGLRRSEWFRILGEEFIDLAFRYADEAFNETYAAPPSDTVAERPVTLFINDYNTEQGGKQDRYLALVERLLARGVPVDGVGHQFHVSLAMPVSALEGALARFADLPVTQAVTELDVTTGTPVSQARLIDQGYYFRDAFEAFRAHADDLFCVTAWGLTDGRSWRVDSGAPLIFDDRYQAKPAYYGAVGAELPARLRTANVFAGDVPLDASATTSQVWDRLPLHMFDAPDGGETAFQLRWAADHLTAFVSVDDAGAAAGDAVTLALGDAEAGSDEELVVARDGSVTGGAEGADAVVAEREGGYDVVVHLPATFEVGTTATFDARVTSGDKTTTWNTPGSLGSLTLIEELSYLEVAEVAEAATAPEIDGEVDDVWATAGTVTTTKEVEGSGGAVATVRTLWRGSTLFVLADVADPVVDVSGSDPWIQDSVEIYVDGGNAKNGGYRADDTQIRVSAQNAVSFGTGDEAAQRARLASATTLTDGGYRVEAAIDLLSYGGPGTFHGLDFQVNDAADGARTAVRNWADPTGAGYQSTARWGVGQLVADAGLVNLTPPAVTGKPAKGKTLTADPGTWSQEATFTYRWLRDGEPIRGGSKSSGDGQRYKVKPWDVGHELSVAVTARAADGTTASATSAPVRIRR
jgi:endo-1,4-beta-xylanase